MKQLVVVATVLAATPLTAAEYDYELSFSVGNSDVAASSSVNGSRFSNDTNTFALTGHWYYDGLSDDKGPRSRAAFLDRASSLALALGRADSEDTAFLPAPTFGPVPQTTFSDIDTDVVGLDLRHVWPSSGWFGLASYRRLDTDFSGRVLVDGQPAGRFSSSSDATVYALGVGKYVTAGTALRLEIQEFDAGSESFALADGRRYEIAVEHVGLLRNDWSFAVDAGVSQVEFDQGGDADGVTLAVSLLPGNSLEFGAAYSRIELGSFSEDELLDIFASWFVRENVEIRAAYREFDPVAAFESDGYDFGINVRF